LKVSLRWAAIAFDWAFDKFTGHLELSYYAPVACIGSIFEDFLALHNFEFVFRPSKKIKRSNHFDKLNQDKKQRLAQKRNSKSPICAKLGFCPSVWWW
jgi:hypothetical protein